MYLVSVLSINLVLMVVTVDYGQNRSNLGRYLNGNTVYQHVNVAQRALL